MKRALLWFRGKDLRLADHQGVQRASGFEEVVPVFVLDPYYFEPKRAQELPHRMQYLLQSLEELAEAIAACGSKLIVRRGRSIDVIPKLAEDWQVDEVIAQGWTEAFGRKRDQIIANRLQCPLKLVTGETLIMPGTIRTQQGSAYSVFTPFWKRFLAQAEIGEPLSIPDSFPPLPQGVVATSESIPDLTDLGISMNPRLIQGGVVSAWERLQSFLSGPAARYAKARNRPDQEGTSRLGPDLKFGTLSARQIHSEAMLDGRQSDTGSFRRQLVWREFAHDLMWNNPHLLDKPFRPKFEGFPWIGREDHWQAWVHGMTGYPIVDAASRQLLATGYIPNRARMITASFLTKHLLIDYRRGEDHFMKWLTDGDWIQNNFGWQWSAGCGCDAQPYFRVFNPVLQGQRFDPTGAYVRQWVPELRDLPKKFIHTPWKAEKSLFQSRYPEPIVDHATARKRFLDHAKGYLASV